MIITNDKTDAQDTKYHGTLNTFRILSKDKLFDLPLPPPSLQ